MQTTEQDTVAKAGSLEEMSLHTLEADRRLRQLAPPMDWDAIAEEGAQQYQAQWDAEPGSPSMLASPRPWFPQARGHYLFKPPILLCEHVGCKPLQTPS